MIKFNIPVTELIYKEVGDRKLILYVINPNVDGKKKPVMLFFNGGSFKKQPQTPVQFEQQAKYFSSKGLVTICVDYRNGSDEGFTPIQAICDAKSAIRWVRKNSDYLGIDSDKVIMCGSSAGGYIAVSSIMFDDLDDDNTYQGTNHVPNALVIYSADMDGVDIMRRRYPELLEEAIKLSPLHNMKNCLPRTLWMCGTNDELYEQNRSYVNSMVNKGNDIIFKSFKDMKHGDFNYGRHDNKFFQDTTHTIHEFLKNIKYI